MPPSPFQSRSRSPAHEAHPDRGPHHPGRGAAQVKRYLAALKLLQTAGRAITAALAVVTLLAGLAPAVAVLASGWLIDALLAAGGQAILAAVTLAALFVISQTATRLATGIATTIGARVDADLQR